VQGIIFDFNRRFKTSKKVAQVQKLWTTVSDKAWGAIRITQKFTWVIGSAMLITAIPMLIEVRRERENNDSRVSDTNLISIERLERMKACYAMRIDQVVLRKIIFMVRY
jgi:hypothetical protein